MIEKMIATYSEFIRKYGFIPCGFILSAEVYAEFRKELREMYPSKDPIDEVSMFMGLPICICSYPCGISFAVQPNTIAKFQ
jgi:hypothetical protein